MERRNKNILVWMLIMISTTAVAQSQYYLKFDLSPSIAWKINPQLSKANFVNPFRFAIGYDFNEKVSFESGIGLNKVGSRSIKTVGLTSVIDGFDSYILEGEIPLKRRITNQFIEIPFQLNFKFNQIKKLKFSFYTRASINFSNSHIDKTWYYYNTDEEFFTENVYVGTTSRALLAFSYQLGINLQRNIFKRLDLGFGINYKRLYHNHRNTYLVNPGVRKYFNIGADIFIVYRLKKKTTD